LIKQAPTVPACCIICITSILITHTYVTHMSSINPKHPPTPIPSKRRFLIESAQPQRTHADPDPRRRLSASILHTHMPQAMLDGTGMGCLWSSAKHAHEPWLHSAPRPLRLCLRARLAAPNIQAHAAAVGACAEGQPMTRTP